MATPLALLVGLGNPGSKYDATRHNAGFWFLDRVAARSGGAFRPEAKFAGDVAQATIGGKQVRLLKPTTFMNRSGQSVAALARFYRVTPSEILVVHDEIDLEPGVARLKEGGGPGGHNGLKDIIAHLGDKNFHRLRLGVGHPGQRDDVINYVLHRPGAEEQRAIDDSIDASLAQLESIVAGKFAVAMNELHRKAPAPEANKAASNDS
ncbi:MAG: aminoacyl-tRNA hydrolase [Chromatiales bacterium]|jgi:peptidyl-tRNA hydrolase, PTH1 family|nr:aminoacyl-tRNA hydrolase [Chromatiales bacterium]